MVDDRLENEIKKYKGLFSNGELSIFGKLIAIEGLDGAGTTTQASLLANYLIDKGYDVLPTKEPTDGVWGGLIRTILAGDAEADPMSLCFAFMADRVDHLSKLHRITMNYPNPLIVTDRYQLSYLAYQQKDTYRDLLWLLTTQEGLPSPDFTIFIDVPPQVCVDRMRSSRSKLERFENIDSLKKIVDGYNKAIEYAQNQGQTIIRFDGTMGIKDLHSEITSKIIHLLSIN
jgi:dTMP kinase